jgi:hypothetical protein
MKMIIDRIEEKIAGSGEGDCIRVSLERDGEATTAARYRVSLLLEKLKKKE